MGTFQYRIELATAPDGVFEPVDALVDTGATYTLVPRSLLERLGVTPVDRYIFVLADGSRAEREVGEALVRIDGRTRTNLVVFGDDEATALLGAVTLESFLLAPDPVSKRLIPVAGYLVTQRRDRPSGLSGVRGRVEDRQRPIRTEVGRSLDDHS